MIRSMRRWPCLQRGDYERVEQIANRLAEKAEEAASSDAPRLYYSLTDKPLKIMNREVAGLLEVAWGQEAAGYVAEAGTSE